MPNQPATIDPVQVFRALGHETRLQIALALGTGEQCVADLRELVGCSWSTASQHLAVLRNAGIVNSVKQGNQVVYHLALPCVTSFTSCLQTTKPTPGAKARTCCSQPGGSGRGC